RGREVKSKANGKSVSSCPKPLRARPPHIRTSRPIWQPGSDVGPCLPELVLRKFARPAENSSGQVRRVELRSAETRVGERRLVEVHRREIAFAEVTAVDRRADEIAARQVGAINLH